MNPITGILSVEAAGTSDALTFVETGDSGSVSSAEMSRAGAVGSPVPRRSSSAAGSVGMACWRHSSTMSSDHSLESEATAVFRTEDAGNPAFVECVDFLRNNCSAAASIHPDVSCTQFVQSLDQVGEELHVAALIRGDRNGVCILLKRRLDDLIDRPVVAEVDHLDSLRLEDATHDVDGGVMPVEQRCGRNPP